MRRCTYCKELKPNSAFDKSPKTGKYYPRCNFCRTHLKKSPQKEKSSIKLLVIDPNINFSAELEDIHNEITITRQHAAENKILLRRLLDRIDNLNKLLKVENLRKLEAKPKRKECKKC